MHPITFTAAAMLVVTAVMIALAGDARAHAPATDATPRPMPRPIMDCSTDRDAGVVECVVRK